MLRVIVTLLAIGLATPAMAQGGAADRAPAEPAPIAGGEGVVPDAEIARRIRAIAAGLTGLDDLSVAVDAGVVTLSGEVASATRADDITAIAERVTGVVAVENRLVPDPDIARQISPAMERVRDRIERAVMALPLVAVALLVFAAVAFFGRVISRAGLWSRLAPNAFIAEIYRTCVVSVFLLLGVVLALDVLNATALLGAVLGAAGVVGLAIGFAVRDTVENFISSVMLSLRQPFRPNDLVEINGELGNVARLTSRATILISPGGNQVRIPNSVVFKGLIKNYTRDAVRRFDFELGVDAEADLAAALSTAVEALEEAPFILRDPPVSAWIKDVGDSNVVLTFAGWVDQEAHDFLKARGEAVRIAKTALEARGFGLPEPIYRLRVDGALPVADTGRPAPAPAGPARVTVAETDAPLPAAADPARRDEGAAEVAARERALGDTGADLLSPERGTE